MEDSASFDRGRTDGLDELRRRLLRARADYLRGAVENPQMGPDEAALALRNRALPEAAIRSIARDRRWMRVYAVKLGVARHPRASHGLARTLLGGLHWRDLAALLADPHVTAPVRLDAERLLAAQVGELTLGENVALARKAGPAVIAALREHRDVAVVRALLGNPRFGERDALAIAESRNATPQALAALAAHREWSTRPAVRAALLANVGTPIPAALKLVEKIAALELTWVAENIDMPRIVRVAAERRMERQQSQSGKRRFG